MKRLEVAIQDSGLTAREIADLSGIDEATLSRILNGDHQPRPRTKAWLSRALGVRVKDLWPVENEPLHDATRQATMPS